MLAFPALNGGKASDWLQPTQQPKWPGADWPRLSKPAEQLVNPSRSPQTVAEVPQEAADACSPRRRAIRRRHSAVDEGRGGHVVARHSPPGR